MWGAIAGMAGGGLLGAISGAQGQTTTQNSSVNVAPAGEAELQAGKIQTDQLTALQQLIGLGPGQQDITNSLNSTRGLAQLLQQYQQGGYRPTQQDQADAGQFARESFAGQQTQLNQSFQDAQTGANRQAALAGRGPNDPIMMNKLMQERTRQQQQLGAQMGSFQAQQAQAAPMQRLEFANQLSGVQGGLASQAMANRQALFGLGSQLKQQEQQFRLGTASRTSSQTSGGGAAGAINGAIAGMGTGGNIAGMFGASFGSGAPAAAAPMASTGQSYNSFSNYA